MNLTENEMMKLAEKVYQGRDCAINEKGILIRGSYKETPGEPDVWQKHFYFSPSLTGSDEQQAQACDVIVAAFNVPREAELHKYDGGGFWFMAGNYGKWKSSGECSDPLTAAARALLSQEPS
jgi:hypothetical protein